MGAGRSRFVRTLSPASSTLFYTRQVGRWNRSREHGGDTTPPASLSPEDAREGGGRSPVETEDKWVWV